MTKEINELLTVPSIVVIGLLILLMEVMNIGYFGKQLLVYTLCVLVMKRSSVVASGIAALLMGLSLVAKHVL
jgi:hypothetical protein